MTDSDRPLPEVPASRSVSVKRTRLSLVWLIPIVAGVAGLWVAATRILGEGPTITLTFASAEGLEAGKTKILYHGVEIGTVTAIRISKDHQHVVTTAHMVPKTDDFLLKDTKFWIVRPRISGATVSGLGTLISGAYITLEIGRAKQEVRQFVALETPPVITTDAPGRYFILKTPDLGSLDNGTPVFFRRLQVGEVASYALDKDGQALTIKIFIHAPYDQYVNPNTHFWHASGMDVSLSADGLRVETQSVMSVLIGGIAFETADTTGPVLPPAEANSVFKLYRNRTDAFKLPAQSPETYLLVFKESVRGLEAGAPVEFHGVTVGEVLRLQAQFNEKTFEVSVPVTIRIDPAAFGVRILNAGDSADSEAAHRKLVEGMVSRGVRAQLRSANVLTGALYVALDFFPKAGPVTLDWSKQPVEIPTAPGQVDVMDDAGSIIKKIDQLPFKQIGDNLQKTLADLDATVVSGRSTLDNANKLIEPNSELGVELSSTLQEVRGAAQSVRVLADYLERHPEALLRGKPEESK